MENLTIDVIQYYTQRVYEGDRFADRYGIAQRLGLSPKSVTQWVRKGVLQPRFSVSGRGGMDFHVYDVEDCAHTWALWGNAHTRPAQARAKQEIADFWQSRKEIYLDEGIEGILGDHHERGG